MEVKGGSNPKYQRQDKAERGERSSLFWWNEGD